MGSKRTGRAMTSCRTRTMSASSSRSCSSSGCSTTPSPSARIASVPPHTDTGRLAPPCPANPVTAAAAAAAAAAGAAMPPKPALGAEAAGGAPPVLAADTGGAGPRPSASAATAARMTAAASGLPSRPQPRRASSSWENTGSACKPRAHARQPGSQPGAGQAHGDTRGGGGKERIHAACRPLVLLVQAKAKAGHQRNSARWWCLSARPRCMHACMLPPITCQSPGSGINSMSWKGAVNKWLVG